MPRPSKTSIEQRLQEAQASRELVRIVRTVAKGWYDGFVVALGERWLTMLVVENGSSYAGFVWLRRADVKSVTAPAPYAEFVKSALRLRKAREPKAPRTSLATTSALLASLRSQALVTVAREIADRNVIEIGKVVAVGRSTFEMLEITPGAKWHPSTTRLRTAEVTRVDVGGPYEEALLLVGGRAPAAASRRR